MFRPRWPGANLLPTLETHLGIEPEIAKLQTCSTRSSFLAAIATRSAGRRAYSKHSFAADPLDLSYSEFGPELTGDRRPTPLVILHGLFGSKRNWNSLAKSLAAKSKAPVFALDLRNHGSSPHSGIHDYDAMAADVAHFMGSKGLPPVHLIGHSMGGKVAMHLALKQSKLTSTLTVVDIAPVAMKTSPLFEAYVRALKKLAAAKPDDLKHANELLSKDVPEKAIRAFLLTNFQPDETLGHLVPIINLDGIANNLVNIFDFPEARHPTSHYHKPCLFLGGTRSDYIDPGKREVYAQLFPTVEIQMIAGAGHWIHSEKPHEFQAALLDFIGKHEHGTISQTDKERYKQRSHQPHDVRKH